MKLLLSTMRRLSVFVLTVWLLNGCAMMMGKGTMSMDLAAYSRNQVMVMIPVTTPEKQEVIANELAKTYQLKRVMAWPLETIKVQCIIYEIPDDRRPSQIAKQISKDKHVDSAQPMNIFRVLRDKTFNDPYYHLQYDLNLFKLDRLHSVATGKNITVAIIDSGLEIDHPELRNSVTRAHNFVTESSTFTGDRHGTAVGGIIAASANNGNGIVGIAPDVKLQALKACTHSQEKAGAVCSSFTLAKALDFSIAHKADLVNLSLGGPHDPVLERLILHAIDSGIAVVAASFISDAGNISFPASMARVIAVTDQSINIPHAISAPGTDILTTVPGRRYDFVSGSSFSAAHVTGVAALILSLKPDISPSGLKDALFFSSDQHTNKQLNPCAALSYLVKHSLCNPR